MKKIGTLFLIVLALSLMEGNAAGAEVTAPSVGAPLGYSFEIANETGHLSNASVAWDTQHQEYLAVWQSNPPQEQHIYAERVSPSGALLGRFTISAPGAATRRNPDLAYNSQQDTFLVVWEQFDGTYYNIRARIYHPNGAIGNEFYLGGGAGLRNRYKPRVAYASTSDKFLVVWESTVVAALSTDIEAQVVTGAGALEGGNFLVATGTTQLSYSEPDLAYNRSRNEYLVAWVRDMTPPNLDIFGRRVTRDGIVLDTNEILIGYHTPDETGPVVAAIPTIPNEGGYLVAWELHYAPGDHDIYARTISGTGTTNSVIIVANTGENETLPAAAGQEDNDQYLVTWTYHYPAPFSNTDLYGRTADLSGVLRDDTLRINRFSGDRSAVAAGRTGDFLIVFEKLASDSSLDIFGHLWGLRVFLPMAIR